MPINQRCRPRGVKVPGCKRSDIRELAMSIRGSVNQPGGKLDVIHLLEIDLQGADLAYLDPVEDDALMDGELARAYPDTNWIQIRNSVYESACDGDGMARFTIAHEIGHLLLHKGCNHFSRYAENAGTHRIFEDSEWQADNFAAELLMPANDIVERGLSTVAEIQEAYGVSQQAAKFRLKNLKDEGLIKKKAA